MDFKSILKSMGDLLLRKEENKILPQIAQLESRAVDLQDYNEAAQSELNHLKEQQKSIPYLQQKAREMGYVQPSNIITVGNGARAVEPQVLGATATAPTPAPQTPATFQDLLQVASQAGVNKGFHPAIIPSQMAVEGARGTSRFARERNNHFGLGAYDADPNKAMSFSSPEESINYYINLIENNPRYKNAFAQRANPEAYWKALMEAGYASDPNYADTLMNTPEYRQFSR